MKTVQILILVFGVAFAIGRAQSAPAVSGPVAYVSTVRIQNETEYGKTRVAKLQALQKEQATDIRTKRQALEATRAQLPLAKDAVARTRLQGQEQQQRAELERAVAQSQTEMQTVQRQISAEVVTKVRAALQDIVKGSPVLIVFNGETSVLWAAPGVDLTTAVVEHMNASPQAAGR